MNEDKNDNNLQLKKRTLPIALIIISILLVALISGKSVVKLRQDLYKERAYNSIRIMDKIAANMQTVIEMQCEHIMFEADLISEYEPKSDSEASAYLKKLEDMGSTDDEKDILLLIDRTGKCLTSDGTLFRWEESGIAQTKELHIIVSSVNALDLADEQMLFLAPLPKEIETADRTFTHICLIMDRDIMDHFLSQASYIENSALFIIQRDGTYLYKRAENSVFANVFNIIAKLEQLDYKYETSADQTVQNIKDNTSDCSLVSVDKENYFVVYESLNINDWTAVYFVPESGASGNSSDFMSSVISTIAILALIVMAVVIAFLLTGHFRSIKQHEIINEQLKRAAEAEHNANSAKTRFLSSMSHDIRTPMNAIVGMTAIAERHIGDKEYVEDCLSKIHLASDHLLTLINDILDISKIESGKMTFSPTVFSLEDFVNNIFNIVRYQVKAKDQTLNIHIETVLHEYLFADELRLNQVFINILNNAVKYTHEFGKIEATIKEEKHADDPAVIRLTYIVQDNGIGMSEEFMENMYSSFSRATDSRINKIQGSGLGLSICKQLIDMMGGTIECESEVGKGTKFTVVLDLPVAKHPSSNYKLPGMKILLVDDDEMFLQTASETFNDMGVILETAENGHDALAMTRVRCEKGDPYSAIFMDWKLADIDGIEAIREIHADINANIPIFLISAYDCTDIEQIALDAGAVGFMRKPFFKASLYDNLCPYKKAANIGTDEDEWQDLMGMNILVVEDNDLNWDIIQELLVMAGLKVERAENGKVGVDRLLESPDGEFDVVLMDVQMPVMDGRQATREIRKSDRQYLQRIPIIATTADAFSEDILACIAAGMNGHVSKPIDTNKLFYELRKIKYKL